MLCWRKTKEGSRFVLGIREERRGGGEGFDVLTAYV